MHGFLILSPNQMNHSLSCFLYILSDFSSKLCSRLNKVIWVISGEYLDFLWDFFGMLIGPNAL